MGIREGIALIVAALLALCGWMARGWYEGAQDAARLEAEEHAREQLREIVGEVATKTEKAIQGIRIENRTIYTQAEKEVLRDVVYRDCVLPDAGRLLINAAREGRSAAGKPDASLRGPAPAP